MLPLGRRHGQGHAGDTATSPRTRLRRALLLPYSPCILPTRVAERRRDVLLLSYPTSSGIERHSPRRAPPRAGGAPQHRPGLRMLRGLVAGAGAVCCGSKMTRVWRGACAAQPCGGRGQTDDPMPGHLAARRRGRRRRGRRREGPRAPRRPAPRRPPPTGVTGNSTQTHRPAPRRPRPTGVTGNSTQTPRPAPRRPGPTIGAACADTSSPAWPASTPRASVSGAPPGPPPRRPGGSAPPCVTWQGACTRLGRGAANRAAPAQPA